MKDKLLIEHIAPYLPYGLMGLFFSKKDLLFGIDGDNILSSLNNGNCLIKDFKPLLVPLSEFTNEHWRNVFECGFNNNINKGYRSMDDFEYIKHDNAIELLLGMLALSLDFDNIQFNTEPRAFNQLAAFKKIYQLHGDLNKLIEKGLAINKLTV